MKNIYIRFIVLLFITFAYQSAFTQAPNWLWAKSAGNAGYENATSVTTDNYGNVYMAGYFESSTLTFGTITLTNDNNSTPAIFLVKYDTDGNVLWAKSAGETGYNHAASITTDASGNVIMVGDFNSHTITFDAVTLTNINADSSGLFPDKSDIFLVKYDDAGNVIWAKRIGGIDWELGSSVTTDNLGNVFLSGNFLSASIIIGSTTLTQQGYYDMFLAKLNGIEIGINENSLNQNITKIYPNPSSGKFTIEEGPSPKSRTDLVIVEIYNLYGEKVYSSPHQLNTTTIDLSDEPDGIYFVQILSGKGVSTEKLIINK